MLLVAENGEGEGKKEAEERKKGRRDEKNNWREKIHCLGFPRLRRSYLPSRNPNASAPAVIPQVDVSRRLRHEFYVFERHEISRKEASDGSRHDFMKRLPLRSSLRKVAIYETDDFVAEGLKTVKNRAQVVKALLLLHTESDDSSQYPRLTSQLSLLSTLSQAGELTLQSLCKKKPVFLQHNRDVSRHDMRHVVEGWPIGSGPKQDS
ncbi:hypothetical protein F2Q68_00017246 [Brassica cretica]|uniref:Uncharacterized protein n=1 Tax=Brassica cretica TaxID=69181 RepID=A0A8S9HS75_BRACR|nr:hypothetical protein F2Q68_00017246 [Brassica cretica]